MPGWHFVVVVGFATAREQTGDLMDCWYLFAPTRTRPYRHTHVHIGIDVPVVESLPHLTAIA